MTDQTIMTVNDYMRAAWLAILCGDYEERDRLIAMVQRAAGERGVIPGDEVIVRNPPGAH